MNRLGRAMADPTRSRILLTLPDGPIYPAAVARELGLSPSNVSNHLRCLLECGLVASDRHGRFIRYRISSPRITVLLNDVDALLDVVAKGVEACDNYREA